MSFAISGSSQGTVHSFKRKEYTRLDLSRQLITIKAHVMAYLGKSPRVFFPVPFKLRSAMLSTENTEDVKNIMSEGNLQDRNFW